jgi:hypothetical protein
MDTIQEGNKLIADFMGIKVVGEDSWDIDNPRLNSWPQSMLHYHTSWDWLMPVIKKIIPHIHNHTMFYMEQDYFYITIKNGLMEVEIDKVWTSVIEAIQWYNQNNQ